MQFTKDVTEVRQVVERVVCDRCALEISEEQFRFGNWYSGAYPGGYGSNPLSDGTLYEWDMCEKCLAEMFDSFKIAPKTETCF